MSIVKIKIYFTPKLPIPQIQRLNALMGLLPHSIFIKAQKRVNSSYTLSVEDFVASIPYQVLCKTAIKEARPEEAAPTYGQILSPLMTEQRECFR